LSVAPLKLPFLTEERARRISRSLQEPDWLLDERLDAIGRVGSLPAESNQLFTPYLDLRQVRFGDVDPYAPPEPGREPRTASNIDGLSALVHVDEDGILERSLSPEASAAGVVIDSFADALRERPELLRAWIDRSVSLPPEDAFAQVARAGFSLGIVVHIPDGVTLERPIVLRATLGAAGRGLISRTVISLGEDAHASVLEDQLPSVGADASDPAARGEPRR
jgi:Fe-S cluster assembly protein SufD